MLAVPIIVIVTLFLGWVLVRLSINALALFVGMFGMMIDHHAGASVPVSVGIGLLLGVCTAGFGRAAPTYVRSPVGRMIVGSVFAAPAAVAAWSAAHGISGLLGACLAWSLLGSWFSAIIVGALAWQKVTVGDGQGAA